LGEGVQVISPERDDDSSCRYFDAGQEMRFRNAIDEKAGEMTVNLEEMKRRIYNKVNNDEVSIWDEKLSIWSKKTSEALLEDAREQCELGMWAGRYYIIRYLEAIRRETGIVLRNNPFI
jgi:hypothetical protein